MVIEAAGLSGGQATVRGEVSSQFLSGLLMVAPYAASPLELSIAGRLVSQPYIRMTLAVMKSFGIEIEAEQLERFRIAAPRSYAPAQYDIEPDASAASYFWAAAAISGGRVAVEGLSRESLQGDVAFCDCLAQMGCPVVYAADRVTVVGGALRGIDVDMNAFSDTVQTLAAVALFADGPTRIRGVAHIRHKETDRIGALAAELRQVWCCGRRARRRPDDCAWQVARRAHRYVSRPPHGNELGARRIARAGRGDQRSRLHGQNLPTLFRGPGPVEPDAELIPRRSRCDALPRLCARQEGYQRQWALGRCEGRGCCSARRCNASPDSSSSSSARRISPIPDAEEEAGGGVLAES